MTLCYCTSVVILRNTVSKDFRRRAFHLGPVTRRSCLEDRLEQGSKNIFGLGLKYLRKKRKNMFFADAKLCLCTVSLFSSRLVSCRLELVMSRDFRFVIGPNFSPLSPEGKGGLANAENMGNPDPFRFLPFVKRSQK